MAAASTGVTSEYIGWFLGSPEVLDQRDLAHSMELQLLQIALLALLGEEMHRQWSCLQAASIMVVPGWLVLWFSLRTARCAVAWSSQGCWPWMFYPARWKITPTLCKSISKMSLSDSPLFIMFQKPETLNHTNCLLLVTFACKAIWTKKNDTEWHTAVCKATSMSKCVKMLERWLNGTVERDRTRDTVW